jgi:hypothetical protein
LATAWLQKFEKRCRCRMVFTTFTSNAKYTPTDRSNIEFDLITAAPHSPECFIPMQKPGASAGL